MSGPSHVHYELRVPFVPSGPAKKRKQNDGGERDACHDEVERFQKELAYFKFTLDKLRSEFRIGYGKIKTEHDDDVIFQTIVPFTLQVVVSEVFLGLVEKIFWKKSVLNGGGRTRRKWTYRIFWADNPGVKLNDDMKEPKITAEQRRRYQRLLTACGYTNDEIIKGAPKVPGEP